jgi:hypothetical protein
MDTTAASTAGAEDTRRDWAIVAITSQSIHCADRQAAEEVAEDRPHLTVVSRPLGGEWEPLSQPVVPVDLGPLSDEQLAALQFEAARLLARRQGRAL